MWEWQTGADVPMERSADGGDDGTTAGDESEPAAAELGEPGIASAAVDLPGAIAEARGSAESATPPVTAAALSADAAPGESVEGDGPRPEPARVQDAISLGVAGERVEVHDAVVFAAAAGEMTADDSLIVVGAVGSLGGNARVLLDVPAALAFGAGCGVVFALLARLLRRRG